MRRSTSHLLKTQAGQAVIESLWVTIQLMLTVHIFIILTYFVYISVIGKHLVYELAICHSRVLKRHHCIHKYRKKVQKLLPFGKLMKLNVTHNEISKKITSSFEFNISLPIIKKDFDFHKSFSLNFPLEDKSI